MKFVKTVRKVHASGVRNYLRISWRKLVFVHFLKFSDTKHAASSANFKRLPIRTEKSLDDESYSQTKKMNKLLDKENEKLFNKENEKVLLSKKPTWNNYETKKFSGRAS